MNFQCKKIHNQLMACLSFIFKHLISSTHQLLSMSPSPAVNKTLQNYFEKAAVFFAIR